MFQIVMKTDVALGNGTRRRGEVLASLNGTPEEWVKRVVDGTAAKQLEKAKLGDDVTVEEVITALRNTQHCDFVDPNKKSEKSKGQEKTEQE